MNSIFDKLMECIFIESKFSLAKIKYFDEDHDWSTSIYVAHIPKGDYFIYLNIPDNLLSYVTNDTQIKMFSLIKNRSEQFEQLNIGAGDVKILPSFDKNATLIIFTTHEVSVNNNIMKQAIAIEEDPYFFKKQVLSISTKELPIISSCFNEHQGNYISYAQNLISDTGGFNEFTKTKLLGMSDKGIEYYFVAKLFEKLPFLKLIVKKSNQDNLQQQINKKLSGKQQEHCARLLDLDVDEFDEWIEEIVKE